MEAVQKYKYMFISIYIYFFFPSAHCNDHLAADARKFWRVAFLVTADELAKSVIAHDTALIGKRSWQGVVLRLDTGNVKFLLKALCDCSAQSWRVRLQRCNKMQ